MKKNINKILPFALLLAVGIAGCQKKLDINKNPNQPAEDVITAEHIYPYALHAAGAQTGGLLGVKERRPVQLPTNSYRYLGAFQP